MANEDTDNRIESGEWTGFIKCWYELIHGRMIWSRLRPVLIMAY